MKIWRYYRIPDQDLTERRYDLYAITNKKEIADEFEHTRDMSKFIRRVTNEPKEVYAEIANNNHFALLGYYDLLIRDVSKNKVIDHTKVSILMAESEYQIISEAPEMASLISEESFWMDIPSYKIYKNKIIKALRLLEYIPFYKLYKNDPKIMQGDDDYTAPELMVDELVAFISTYKNTFK